ncbi:glycosyltransferase family 2 protein [Salinicola rhizosphaerae]|uniref:Glycosyl transferase family 2 n=1 Tax=Salinicola rhizosphaerae TaxID=1443141 RepID=A0ABQ3DQ35_9GAMM|nr:glycosyltransferase family 2 protein [Salinicola rhizosphaerae]GHB07644.1 hypothetical protein GCM10009038_01090 [Salinicola rhizosphaerae]
MTTLLTRLCAVAKDEGPYLAEWVFHHLHLGFDQIHVILNRTSDHSAALLERIGRHYPQVTFEFIDWIDVCDPGVSKKLQTIAYAKALDEARRAGVDWLMFLDVDEFWTPRDLATPIGEFIARMNLETPSPISFLWHCELGQREAFTPLSNGSGYELSSHLKTLTPIQTLNIRKVRIHCPLFDDAVVVLDAEGQPMAFREDEPELAASAVIAPKSAYVIHRMFRSEDEYLALLLRGRPSGKSELKTNRRAYRSHENVDVKRRNTWPREAFRDYRGKRSAFMKQIGARALIERDRRAVLNRSERAVVRLKSMLATHERDQAVTALKGTRHWASASQAVAAPASETPIPAAPAGESVSKSSPAQSEGSAEVATRTAGNALHVVTSAGSAVSDSRQPAYRSAVVAEPSRRVGLVPSSSRSVGASRSRSFLGRRFAWLRAAAQSAIRKMG